MLMVCIYVYCNITFQIFEGVEKNELCQTKPYSAKVTSCIFSMEGKRIAVGLQSGEIEVRLSGRWSFYLNDEYRCATHCM